MKKKCENQIIFVFNGLEFFRVCKEANDRWVEIKEKTLGISLVPDLYGGRSWNSSLSAYLDVFKLGLR